MTPVPGSVLRICLRICFLGDSFVNGTGDVEGLGWAGRVCAQARRRGHDVTRYDLGIRGDTSADIAARWREETARRLPAEHDPRLVFSFGANDVMPDGEATRVAQAQTRANAQAILSAAARVGPVLMVGPPPVADDDANARIAGIDALLGDVCDRLSIPFLSVYPALEHDSVWRREAASGDGAHPGAAGYEKLAALVEEWPAWRAWVP